MDTNKILNYIYENCPNKHVGIIWVFLKEILYRENRIVFFNGKQVEKDTPDYTIDQKSIKYILCSIIDNYAMYCMLKSDNKFYYVINIKGDPIKSTIRINTSLIELIKSIPNAERTQLKLPTNKILKNLEKVSILAKVKDAKEEHLSLWDCTNEDEIISYMNTQLHNKKEIIRDIHFITDEVLDKLNPEHPENIEELELVNMMNINTFTWMKKFTNIHKIVIDNCCKTNNGSIFSLCQNAKTLTHFTIRNSGINIFVLIPLLRLENIDTIVIDGNIQTQVNVYKGSISTQEWKTLENTKVKHIDLNTTKITIDTIDDIVSNCKSLETFILADNAFKMLADKITSVIYKTAEQIPKQSIQNKHLLTFKNGNTGETMCAEVPMEIQSMKKEMEKFVPFSQSMLKIIEEKTLKPI